MVGGSIEEKGKGKEGEKKGKRKGKEREEKGKRKERERKEKGNKDEKKKKKNLDFFISLREGIDTLSTLLDSGFGDLLELWDNCQNINKQKKNR